MPDFIVTVCRTANGFRDFLVKDADNAAEAQRRAKFKAPNFEFSEKNSEYESVGVIELEPGDKPGSNLPQLKPDETV